jgi:hypothetical protein
VVGNIEAAALKDYRRGMENAAGFTLTAGAHGLRLVIEALLLIEPVAARAAFIFIDRHG